MFGLLLGANDVLLRCSRRFELKLLRPLLWTCTSVNSTDHQMPLLCLSALSRAAPVAAALQHQLTFRLFSMSSAAAAGSGPTTATPPANTARGATADLADVFIPEPVDEVSQRKVNIMEPIFQDLGGNLHFSGQVSTVKCFENNPLVRKAFEQPGNGRVLVVDGGGSKRCALLGDNIAEMAYKNGWSGVIINGCIRDSEDIAKMPLGVKALGTYPLKSSKRDPGLSDVPVTIAGVTVHPGDWVYADKDGVLVAKEELKL